MKKFFCCDLNRLVSSDKIIVDEFQVVIGLLLEQQFAPTSSFGTKKISRLS
jgi:hypothetical protein